MHKLVMIAACACFLFGCDKPPEVPPVSAQATLISGIDLRYVDDRVRPQDDLYTHINGKWIAVMQIPADKGRYGPLDKMDDDTLAQLRAIVEGLLKSAPGKATDEQKIADLYSAFMDESGIEERGLRPLAAELARVDALEDRGEIPALIAHFNRIGASAPYTPYVHLDARDSTKYVFDLRQDGLGMPDRDYYLLNDDRMETARAQYGHYVENMLSLAGDRAALTDARDIIALETELAKAQWTRVENLDPIKTYNKVEFTDLAALAPGYDWTTYLAEAGVRDKTHYLVIRQPSYISNFNKLLRKTPVSVWKAYFRWRLLNDFSPYLGKSFVSERFAFYGTALRGILEDQPRWERGITLVDKSIGEGLGRLYVAQYFPPESKARIDQLVRNLLAAYKADIDTLDWMSPRTKQKAEEKLAKIVPAIGYPAKWRDYSALQISRDDLVGDVIAARTFEYDRNLNKLGKPADRGEWLMTPQTVNANYDPETNQIAFPAAILQPPFFNALGDDAVNYGAIGAVIGHEISHGFDDEGSQYDGDGNLLNPPGWFT